MNRLFERILINGMSLANRFVRSATWEGLANKDGSVSQKLTEKMVELAKGEVGLIITGYAFVRPEGQSTVGQLAVYDDRFVAGLKKMAQAVHAANGKSALQIVHGGTFSNPALTGMETVGPSSSPAGCRSLKAEEMGGIILAFTQAARRAMEAGFDAIQVHGAHGFLLSGFLSAALNKRTDEYGGSLENRARLLLDVVRSIRKTVGPGFPLLVKLNSEDFITSGESGLTREESVQVSKMLEKESIDAIEFSGGTLASPEKLIPARPGMLKNHDQEVYYRQAAKLYKKEVSIPLMLVGGIRSYEVAEELIQSGTTDYISLSRPLIAEPGLVKRWQEGDRRKAECISCNSCFGVALEGKGLYCVVAEKKRQAAGK
jgi:2,4-dienoyl-CoA reductase-like NADH-dependent reductase (Old Yellow Enzyme family)